MTSAAMGIRMHSGWGAFVVTTGDAVMVEVIHRGRIVVADPKIAGTCQPYHYAAKMGLPEAKSYLSNCARNSGQLAIAALDTVVQELGSRGYRVVGSAVLLASCRQLPSLVETLASHPLIHTGRRILSRRVLESL
jgi:hypothetical protein